MTDGTAPAQAQSSLPPWRVEQIEANGLSFETAVLGEGPELALCLHGFPEHFAAWRFQAPMLAARGYQVWAPNLRGYGRSSRPKGVAAYRLEHLLDDVAGLYDVAQARGLKPKVLMAHDWGGLIAWAFVLNQVRPFERFVPINIPHPVCFARNFWRKGQALRSWYIAFFQLPWLPEALLGLGGARRLFAAMAQQFANKQNFPSEILEIYRENAAQPDALTAMINYYRANFRRLSPPPQMFGQRRTDTPTLLIWGEADAYLGAHLNDGLERYVSDLTVSRLPGVSHWAQQDAPQAVNAAIEAWLDAPASSSPNVKRL